MQRSRQTDGKGVGDAGTQELLSAAEVTEGTGGVTDQDGAIGGLAVGQLALGPAPHALVGVELRRIGGEVLETKARVTREQSPHERATVDVRIVEQHADGTAKMTKQVAQERHHVERVEVLVQLAVEVEPAATPAGAEREGRDDRDTVVPVPVTQQGRVTPWRPGAPHGGRQLEARFVEEDEVGSQPRGVFFTRAQPRFFQRSFAASSRSSARRSGFWALQPI
jgi:hypothetical protein